MTIKEKPQFTPRASFASVSSYEVGDDYVAMQLADNTSPFGAPPAALRVLREMPDTAIARYPSTYSHDLRAALADYVGVAADEIMIGAGSDEAISSTFRGLADPGARVAYQDPTFVMARVFTVVNSQIPVPIPLMPGSLQPDMDALVAADATFTYLCNPNNPTGVAIEERLLQRAMNEVRGLLLVDEAYAEFSGTSLAASAPAHGHMLVYRTLSKAFGMAGLRVGYVVGNRSLIRELQKARGPYTVSAMSERAALAAVTEDRAWVTRAVSIVTEARQRFAAALSEAGFQPIQSAANFVLVPVADAAAATATLLASGFLVRQFTALPVVGDAIRVSIADWPTMQRVAGVMKEQVKCA